MQKPFNNLISQYGVALTKLCMSLCNNQFDAQDLYQSTWEKAMRKYKKYDNSKPFEKWLFTIAIHSSVLNERRY